MNKSNKSITDKGFTLMDNFRENINSYIGNMTLSELSERAGIPFSTLRGMLYENSSDCNLSNAVKLAKVFSISVDELFGANTMEERTTRLFEYLQRTSGKFEISDQLVYTTSKDIE